MSARKDACYSDRDRRPPRPAFHGNGIPEELRALPRWVGWKFAWKDDEGRWTKVPLNPHTDCIKWAKSNDPKTWCSYETARAAANRRIKQSSNSNPECDGIGFMFHGDGIFGLDIDGCRDPETGELSPLAAKIVNEFATYTEVSPSGMGIKLFGHGVLPWKKGRKVILDDGQELELYDRVRYFTVTGQLVPGAATTLSDCGDALTSLITEYFPDEKKKAKPNVKSPSTPSSLDDEKIIELICRRHSALWAGSTDGHGGDDSRADLALCNIIAFFAGPDAKRIDAIFRQSGLMREKWERPDYSGATIGKALEGRTEYYGDTPKNRGDSTASGTAEAGPTYPRPVPGELWNDPHRLARLFAAKYRTPADEGTLVHFREEYHAWNGTAWGRLGDADLDAMLARHCRDVFRRDLPQRIEQAQFAAEQAGKEMVKIPDIFPVTTRTKSDCRLNLSGIVNYPDSGIDPPLWLPGANCTNSDRNPLDVIAAPNGLFTIEDIAAGRGSFALPTPTFFTPNALTFPIPQTAPEPTVWLRCLHQWFNGDGDAASIAGLQQWFGYLLSASTALHKILLIVGPRRSGKGTILRVLTSLIGAANIASTTFAALGENFGLENLLGKRIALIPDARLSGRSDTAAIVERLLSISGEDSQSVNRKNRQRITTRLRVRFVLASNELPRLPDASGAIDSRFYILSTPNSWLGKEDHDLGAKLESELPAILLWAARGWDQLRQQGYRFTENAAAEVYRRELADLSSPIGAFIRECCLLRPDDRVDVPALFHAWRRWNEARHREVSSENIFGRDLRAAMPHVRVKNERRATGRMRVYCGIGLKSEMDWGDDDNAPEVERNGTRSNPTHAWRARESEGILSALSDEAHVSSERVPLRSSPDHDFDTETAFEREGITAFGGG